MALNPVDSLVVDRLHEVLPSSLIRSAEPKYLEEPRGAWTGTAGILVLPETTEQVSQIVKIANETDVGILPYGGGTGLVGGQVYPDGPSLILLSLERMNKIRAIYPSENVIVTDAGAILADVQAAAEQVDRLFPLSLASEGSARIGGNLATNAGGVNVLRYGNARDLCLGLEVVMPDGEIWNGLTRLRKDNTGYDLRNLMIGSEGTLGIITAAALKLAPLPKNFGTALLVTSSPSTALDLLSLARAHAAEGISAFELIHRQGLEFISETLPDVRHPFTQLPEWMVLIDLGLSEGAVPEAVLEQLFCDALEQGLVSDGVIAQSEKQRADFWMIREQIPTANRLIGSISSHDISIPLSLIPEFIERAGPIMRQIDNFRINCFGHLGDGNLHYNIFPEAGKRKSDYPSEMKVMVQSALHDLVYEMEGSMSAEHGVGRLKVDDLETYADPVKLATMKAIKATLDPKGLMNPGAVLRNV